MSSAVQQRVAAMLASYEARSIDAAELHGRLLKALHGAGSEEGNGGHLQHLLDAVDEAMDLGQNERELVAWAAARFWRSVAEDS